MSKNKKGLFPKFRKWYFISIMMMIYDFVAIMGAYFLGLWFRFDCNWNQIPAVFYQRYYKFTPIYAIVCIIVHQLFKLYQSYWSYAGYDEMYRVTLSTAITGLFHFAAMMLFYGRMPLSYFIIGILLQFVLVLTIRLFYRFFTVERHKIMNSHEAGNENVMIIGAGDAGLQLLRDLTKIDGKDVYTVKCFIDDDNNKWGRYILGVPIVGGRRAIMKAVKEYRIEKILVSIPSISKKELADILNICKETGCEIKIVPSISQLVNGEVTFEQMRDVPVEDLLGREPISVDIKTMADFLENKIVLVTGGGGSIGSELCRQIATLNVKELIIFDIYENDAYEIQQELLRKHPDLNLKVLIGSVRDSRRINQVFKDYKPNIVFHAAAHKHVPLMENSPCEAIKNNVIGTYKTAFAALKNDCERFVLISTDKAVNPTNVMGASKRMCEMVIQSFDNAVKTGTEYKLPVLGVHDEDNTVERMNRHGRTEYVAVRFGNVLGSHGSVIPLFKKQIEDGGPVTVTHPDIIRYFMTIPEAVSLVLQAGAYAKGGEIFVLDMGAPVKIDTLARNLIKLSGHIPDVDIKIVYTGLRPGEKLYEEKLLASEGNEKTPNNLIFIGHPDPFDYDEFTSQLEGLMNKSYENDSDIIEDVKKIVKTYKPAPQGTTATPEIYNTLMMEAIKELDSEG